MGLINKVRNTVRAQLKKLRMGLNRVGTGVKNTVRLGLNIVGTGLKHSENWVKQSRNGVKNTVRMGLNRVGTGLKTQ